MAGIYLHIPYCIKKCAYCDFVSFPEPHRVGAYARLLEREIELASEQLPIPAKIDTVFFGGGTPSLLDGADMASILDTLRRYYPIAPDAEITAECNPGTATKEKLTAHHTAGINRLSVGLQSADDALLKSIGRIHTCDRFLETMADAVAAGFTNINVDVMHGLPNQTEKHYLDTLRLVSTLEGVTHISAYALILEEETPLFHAVESGRVSLPDADAVADMQDAGFAFLAQNGFIRYEIANYAREGFRCRHNLNYWNNGEYLGFGLAAHGVLRENEAWTRRANTTDPDRYAACIRAGNLPTEEKTMIDRAEEMFESVMLALRTVDGLSISDFAARYGISFTETYQKPIKELVGRGWAILTTDRFALTDRGLDLQNEALLLFL